jgi:hypothetical protein
MTCTGKQLLREVTPRTRMWSKVLVWSKVIAPCVTAAVSKVVEVTSSCPSQVSVTPRDMHVFIPRTPEICQCKSPAIIHACLLHGNALVQAYASGAVTCKQACSTRNYRQHKRNANMQAMQATCAMPGASVMQPSMQACSLQACECSNKYSKLNASMPSNASMKAYVSSKRNASVQA